jgi:WD40 repeat protein
VVTREYTVRQCHRHRDVLAASVLAPGHRGFVGCSQPGAGLAIGRAGERDVIVSASFDGTIRVWDASTRRPIGRPLTGHDGQVLSVAMGRAGKQDLIVSGSSNGTLLIRHHREPELRLDIVSQKGTA